MSNETMTPLEALKKAQEQAQATETVEVKEEVVVTEKVETPIKQIPKEDVIVKQAQPKVSKVTVLPATPVSKIPVNKNQNLLHFDSLVNTWTRIQKEGNAKQKCIAFKAIMDFVLNNQDDNQLLEALRKLFIKYRDSYLSLTNALQGINKALPNEDQRNKMSVFYMLMYELINPKRTRNTYNLEFASKVLQNPKCRIPNGYVAFIANRMR